MISLAEAHPDLLCELEERPAEQANGNGEQKASAILMPQLEERTGKSYDQALAGQEHGRNIPLADTGLENDLRDGRKGAGHRRLSENDCGSFRSQIVLPISSVYPIA